MAMLKIEGKGARSEARRPGGSPSNNPCGKGWWLRSGWWPWSWWEVGQSALWKDLQVSWMWGVEKEINQDWWLNFFSRGTTCMELTSADMGRLGKEQDWWEKLNLCFGHAKFWDACWTPKWRCQGATWIFESAAWERSGLAIRIWELILNRALAKVT